MLNTLKLFLKTHVAKTSVLWKIFEVLRAAGRRVERFKSTLLLHLWPASRMNHLQWFEFKVYSQNGEDGILQAIFKTIGTGSKFGVEFGVGNGAERNTRFLCAHRGWTALLMDAGGSADGSIRKEFITAENINTLFQKYQVPRKFDLLSIDIDGNDYWIWEAIDPAYTPRVVMIEYNAKIPVDQSSTVAYDPAFSWDGTDYFGASLRALEKLGRRKGYVLVGCDRQGVNAFFVRQEHAASHIRPQSLEKLYRPPQYGLKQNGGGWPRGSKTMVSV